MNILSFLDQQTLISGLNLGDIFLHSSGHTEVISHEGGKGGYGGGGIYVLGKALI